MIDFNRSHVRIGLTGVMKSIDLEKLQPSALEACSLLRVLSNPDRLLLLCQMTQGEYCVSELQELTGVLQPTLSQQLTVLRDEELVKTRREGKQIYYTVASKEAVAILRVLYELYCEKSKGVKK
jgi:ArsR family transcriptional regulator